MIRAKLASSPRVSSWCCSGLMKIYPSSTPRRAKCTESQGVEIRYDAIVRDVGWLELASSNPRYKIHACLACNKIWRFDQVLLLGFGRSWPVSHATAPERKRIPCSKMTCQYVLLLLLQIQLEATTCSCWLCVRLVASYSCLPQTWSSAGRLLVDTEVEHP
jgi:hypothetical protein